MDSLPLEPLSRELAAVQHILRQQFQDLDSAIRLLLDEDAVVNRPLPLAGIVLAASYPALDTPQDQERRQFLAAALELLHTAFNIHKILLSAGEMSLDRTQAGAAILLGDFCFSRAAHLAAGTEIPKVVEIFAQALKQVSAGNLRQLLPSPAQEDGRMDGEMVTLCMAGVDAGAKLAGLSTADKKDLTVLGQEIAYALDREEQIPDLGLERTPPHQRLRWQTFFTLHPTLTGQKFNEPGPTHHSIN